MKKVIILNKKEGETPLAALEAFRRTHSEYKNLPMTYAGRLDPMASGVLVILAGDKVKEKEKFLGLEKEYEFEVLFGFTTDTYDILGKIKNSQNSLKKDQSKLDKEELRKLISENLKFFTGTIKQKYPPYSSKTVNGKPLFAYAREGQQIEAPTREVSVKSLRLIKIRKISSEQLLANIEKRIARVSGDFRQGEIIQIWRRVIVRPSGSHNHAAYLIAAFKIRCSSGTYVRTIANSLGNKLKTPALAYKIKRTRVGKMRL